MDKVKELEKIAREIENCKTCKKDKIGKAVVGEGNPDAEIAFIGEAPGKKEAETGRPFIGRSGQLLRSLIKEIGLLENGVYITSPVKYLPKRGTPTISDINHGKGYLLRQLSVINPKVVVLLGNVASKALIETPIFVNKDHGKIIEKGGRKFFITFHPAAALRFPKIKDLLKKDFEKLKYLIQELK